jgi:DNA-binding MarR family transcriptional regulator
MKIYQHALPYLKFLNLLKAVQGLSDFPVLDALEERLLNSLAAVWPSNSRISVMEAISLLPSISPATVHRRLKTLQKKGLLKVLVDENDNRLKYLLPTDITTEYFAKLTLCMTEAQQG